MIRGAQSHQAALELEAPVEPAVSTLALAV
jgi:hypothetical protein